jgi:DNA polymerase-3 subunit epsilon
VDRPVLTGAPGAEAAPDDLPEREPAAATPLSGQSLAFVDVETTGGHPAWHRVTEVAIVTMRDGVVEEEWSALVNPGTSIPPSIQALTGITPDMVRDAPPFAELAPQVLSRLEGRRFVAHNARFDYGFLRAELARAGHRFTAPLICTVRLSRRLDPDGRRHNLDAVIERHGLACEARHRALPDARALAQVWDVWRRSLGAAQLDAAILEVSRRPSLPSHLPPDLIDDLPEAPGVYRFLADSGVPIYIGKANNLRERVLGHFMGATRDAKSQRLAAQTRRIEWTETAGELGALLLESRLVRDLKPVYNRRLRGGGGALSWLVPDDGGAPRAVDPAEALRAGDAFGIYPSERAARTALTRLARDAKLCLRVLGLQSGTGSCFGLQVGRCAGACVGREPLARHGARLKLALLPFKLKAWPWRGPVGVRETGSRGVSQVHVVDRWQYLGSLVAGDDDGWPRLRRDALSFQVEDAFDADTYRILSRYLKPGDRNVRVLDAAPRADDP